MKRLQLLSVALFYTDSKEDRSCWYILLFYDALTTCEVL